MGWIFPPFCSDIVALGCLRGRLEVGRWCLGGGDARQIAPKLRLAGLGFSAQTFGHER